MRETYTERLKEKEDIIEKAKLELKIPRSTSLEMMIVLKEKK